VTSANDTSGDQHHPKYFDFDGDSGQMATHKSLMIFVIQLMQLLICSADGYGSQRALHEWPILSFKRHELSFCPLRETP
jgi:hypothetical protein